MPQKRKQNFLPAVRRARIERLDIYEISEVELQVLERGSPESIFLNFAVFLLSTAISFLVAILTTEIQSPRIFNVFVIVTAMGFICGIFLLVLWVWYRSSTKTLLEQIRRRMPPEGVPTTEIEVIKLD